MMEAAQELDHHYIPPRYTSRRATRMLTPPEPPMSTTPEPSQSERLIKVRGSSSSVTVIYVDFPAVNRYLRRAVEALVREHPEIERILLFGSFATGQAVPGSDLDLLIILKQADRRFHDRMPLYRPPGCDLDVDVFPYTQVELDSMLADGNWFIRRALAEGVQIYPTP